MKYYSEADIIHFFNALNKSALNYILLRNIGNELPAELLIGKDIDLLIKKTDEEKFIALLTELSFKQMPHPHQNDVFLYGIDRFEKYLNKVNGLMIDLNFQLCVRSLDQGQWIPLDIMIQESAWNSKIFDADSYAFPCWTLSVEDEFITLIARSIFDKKDFSESYRARITALLPKVNLEEVENKMRLVFFKYTPYLLDQVKKKEYSSIIKNYLAFTNY